MCKYAIVESNIAGVKKGDVAVLLSHDFVECFMRCSKDDE